MKRITRAVSPIELSDLLESRKWASMALVKDGRLRAQPVRFAFDEGRYLVDATEEDGLEPGTAVSLLVDDGVYHTDLRGIRIQGMIGDSISRHLPETYRDWVEVIPRKITAWDYGAMRRLDQ